MPVVRSAEAATVDELRRQAGQLRAAAYDYARIGEVLGISPIRARDLARQFERARQEGREFAPPQLSRRAMLNLVVGRHGAAIARDVARRFARIVDIAARYTWDELLSEEDIGPKTALEIRHWLAAQGRSLRAADAPQQADAALEPAAPVKQRAQVARRRVLERLRHARRARGKEHGMPVPPRGAPLHASP